MLISGESLLNDGTAIATWLVLVGGRRIPRFEDHEGPVCLLGLLWLTCKHAPKPDFRVGSGLLQSV